MRIRSIEIRSFRKFAPGVRVSGFSDGLNLLVAPNEFGKSTIVAALRGLIFEKYRAKTEAVRGMRTQGHETSPWIALDFDLPGGSYRLEKRFLHREAFARLEAPGGRRFEGDAAEEELQRLLTFHEPGKQGATADSKGIWGLLWLEQGQSLKPPALTETGRAALQGCLDGEVRQVTGGERGKRIHARVEAEIKKFLDGNRKPTGDWKKGLERAASLHAEIEQDRARRKELLEDIESLDQKKARRKELASDGEDGRLAADIARLEADVTAAREFASRLQNAAQLAENLTLHRDGASREEDARRKLATAIAENEKAMGPARVSLDEARNKAGELREAKKNEAEAERALSERLLAARRDQEALRKAWTLFERRQLAGGLEEALGKARAAAGRAADAEGRASAIRVSAAGLKELKALERAVQSAQAAHDALATRVRISLADAFAGRVRVGGRVVSDRVHEALLTAPASLEIEGVASIEIRPGANDADEAERTLREAVEKRTAKLATMSAVSLEEAEARWREKESFQSDAVLAKRDVETLTRERTLSDGTRIGAGLDALAKAVATLRAEVETLSAEELPEVRDRESFLAEQSSADAEIQAKESNARAARARIEELGTRLQAVISDEQAYGHAVADLERAIATSRGELNRRRDKEDDEALGVRLAGLQRDLNVAAAAHSGLKDEEGRRETAKTLETRLSRFKESQGNRAKEKAKLDVEVGQLQMALSIRQGAGLEERLTGLEADLEMQEKARAHGERRLAALQLLESELTRAETEAKERYLAPVKARIEPYLRALFPGASVRCGEDLEIESIARGGVEENLDILSGGTAEQIAVLTRLAFAELLLDSGRPAAVILDDALAFSDAARMDRMFDVLAEVSKKVQVTIFSCREKAFERLGATQLVVEQLEAGVA